jgi:hypothetical protein
MPKSIKWLKNTTATLAIVMATSAVHAEKTKVPVSITTPDRVETKIGTLQFNDGYPKKLLQKFAMSLITLTA